MPTKAEDAEVERLTVYAVKTFRSHWQSIRGRLEARDRAFVRDRIDHFWAPKRAERHSLARRYYSVAHARRLAALDEQAVREQLPYLSGVLRCICHQGDSARERSALVKSILRNEHVLLECAGGQIWEHDPLDPESYGMDVGLDWSEWRVVEYPNSPVIGDFHDLWSCSSLWRASNFSYLIYRTTGEPFDDGELGQMDRAIFDHCVNWSDADPVWYRFWPHHQRQVYFFFDDVPAEAFVEDLVERLEYLSRPQLLTLVRGLRRLYGQPAHAELDARRALRDAERLDRDVLEARVGELFQEPARFRRDDDRGLDGPDLINIDRLLQDIDPRFHTNFY